MPRKDVPACESEKSVFAERLTQAMKEHGENQTTLAEKITEKYVTIQRQTISLYMNGQSKPDTERLTAIAKVLDVSADWLLGLTNDKDTRVRAVDMLGISSDAMDNLLKCCIDFPGIVSDFFSSSSFWGLMVQISRLKKEVQATKQAHKIVHKEGLQKAFGKSNAIKSIEDALSDFLGYAVSFVEPHHKLYGTLDGIKISAEELAKELSGYNDLSAAELIDHIYDFDSREIGDFLKYIEENSK